MPILEQSRAIVTASTYTVDLSVSRYFKIKMEENKEKYENDSEEKRKITTSARTQTPRSTQPSIPPGWVNRVPACQAGVTGRARSMSGVR